jgi:hypothetical protein
MRQNPRADVFGSSHEASKQAHRDSPDDKSRIRWNLIEFFFNLVFELSHSDVDIGVNFF